MHLNMRSQRCCLTEALRVRSQRCCVAVDGNRENCVAKIFGMKVAIKWNKNCTQVETIQFSYCTGGQLSRNISHKKINNGNVFVFFKSVFSKLVGIFTMFKHSKNSNPTVHHVSCEKTTEKSRKVSSQFSNFSLQKI